MSKKVTMQTIADEVGVSVTTVSHVINRTRPVDISLRKKIIEAMERLEYNKDRSQAQKRKSLTSHIGLVIPNLKDLYFFQYIIQTVETIANENGYTLLLGDSVQSPEKELEIIDLFLKKQVSGLIVAPVTSKPQHVEALPLFHTTPTVLIDRKWDSNKYDFVGVDNFKASFDMARSFIQQGYKNIHFFSMGPLNTTLKERQLGFTTALESDIHTINYAVHNLNPLYDITKQMEQILQEHNAMDAIVVYNPNTLYVVLSAFKEFNLSVPKDIKKIASYDDVPWFKFFDFPITIIQQPGRDIGMNAIKLLIEKVESQQGNDKDTKGKQVLFPTDCIDYNPLKKYT